ncbi:MAG: hypothetical protein AAFX06_27230 [Planctomycetota bacterium]
MTDDAPETTDAPQPAAAPAPSDGASTSIVRLLAIAVGLVVVAAGVVGYSFWDAISENSGREVSIVEGPGEGESGMGGIEVPTGQPANMDPGYSGPPPGVENDGDASPDSGRPEADTDSAPDADASGEPVADDPDKQ